MDWLQFIASVVGSVAWPALLAFFLWLIRERIGALLSRMIELHFPGGAKAVFAQELDKGRDALERIELPIARRARTRDSLPLEYQNIQEEEPKVRPSWVIAHAYAEIETLVNQAREKLHLSPRMPSTAVIKSLIQDGYVENGTLELFESLRRANNAIVHAPSREVTVGEAVEYQIQASGLSIILMEAIKKLTQPKPGQ
jgi:hypothetical protein